MEKRRIVSLCLVALWRVSAQTPEDTKPVTLNELVRIAIERNRDLLALRQQINEARALRQQAGVRPAPTIEIGGGTGKAFGENGREEYEASYTHPVETFRKRERRVRVAELSIRLADAEVAARSTQLAYTIETGYLELIYERQKLDLFNRLLQVIKESSRLTDTRVREGDAAPLEAQLLTVEQGRTEALRVNTAGKLASVELDLKRTVGLAAKDATPAITLGGHVKSGQ